jgi:diguanylate cyclase (GGDEF)-like protein
VARLGGEEFGVVLLHTSKQQTVASVDAFREQLALQFFNAGGTEVHVTISAGVSQGNGKFTYSMLLTNADKALYLAKASGRNRVVHADEIVAIVPDNGNSSEKIAI